MRRYSVGLALLPLILASCTGDGAALDSTIADAPRSDLADAPRVDGATDSRVDGPPGPVPLPGFGALSGQCGELDDQEWTSSLPFTFRNAIDFGALDFDEEQLSPGGKRIIDEGNLNDGSLHSEVFAFEVLRRCELAALLKTEAKIDYKDPGKMTDLLVSIDGRKVGVSVTRAFHYPPEQPYTTTEAAKLLEDKLSDVLASAANAEPWDAWERSILHVIAYDAQYADELEAAYGQLSAAVKDRTILMITVTEGNDDYLY